MIIGNTWTLAAGQSQLVASGPSHGHADAVVRRAAPGFGTASAVTLRGADAATTSFELPADGASIAITLESGDQLWARAQDGNAEVSSLVGGQ